jgi:hypothetical protein
MREAGSLDDESCRRLGAFFLESNIPAAAFGSVASIFINAVGGAVSSDEIVPKIINALQAGGGIPAVEKAVGRGAPHGQGPTSAPDAHSPSPVPGNAGHPSGRRE